MSERSSDITVGAIRSLVESFYAEIRRDPELGPIFERVVGGSPGGWPEHLDKLTAFWSAVLLQIPGYQGNPRLAHAAVRDIEPHHFARWLALWEVEVDRRFEAEPAYEIVSRAHAIGFNLRRAQFAPAW